MKHLLFVRHGESESNIAHVHSNVNTELTPRGEEQVRQISEQCYSLSIDTIISSPIKRARDTASIIQANQDRNIDIVENQNIIEWQHPSDINGLHKTGKKAMAVKQQIREHSNDPHWHYSDEENFVEFRERVLAALIDFREYDVSTMLIVTHQHFLRMLVAVIIHGKYIEPDMYYDFENVLTLDNTGITYIRLHDDGFYELVTWNNVTHINVLHHQDNTYLK